MQVPVQVELAGCCDERPPTVRWNASGWTQPEGGCHGWMLRVLQPLTQLLLCAPAWRPYTIIWCIPSSQQLIQIKGHVAARDVHASAGLLCQVRPAEASVYRSCLCQSAFEQLQTYKDTIPRRQYQQYYHSLGRATRAHYFDSLHVTIQQHQLTCRSSGEAQDTK